MDRPRHETDARLSAALARSRWLAPLPTDIVADLVARARLRHLRPGELLRIQGTVSDLLFVVISGRVKEHVITDRGDDVVIEILGPGDSVGFAALVEEEHRGRTCLTALEPVDALVLQGVDVRDVAGRHPAVTTQVLRALADRRGRSVEDRVRLVADSPRRRVLSAILELTDRYGEASAAGIEVSVPLTQEEIGTWTGVSRETIAKVLHDLRARGVLRTGRRRMTVLDLDRLERDLLATVDDDVVVLDDGGELEIVTSRR